MKGENSLGREMRFAGRGRENIKAKPFEGFAFDLFDV